MYYGLRDATAGKRRIWELACQLNRPGRRASARSAETHFSRLSSSRQETRMMVSGDFERR